MATLDQHSANSTFTGDAIDLLDCFSNGFDDVLSSMAEQVAAERMPNQPVEVSSADISEAAKQLTAALEKANFPESVQLQLTSMMDCMSRQLRQGK